MSTVHVSSAAAGAAGRVVLIFDEHILYDTPILLRTRQGVPDALPENWAANILAHIDDRFIPGWESILTDDATFQTKLVDPATTGYAAFLAPGKISRHGRSSALSTALHSARLGASYDKMVTAIAYLTGAGRDTFEDAITSGQDAYRSGEALPLSLTGTYLDALLGAATRQWFFLGESPKFPFYQWLSDVVEGKFPPDLHFLAEGPKWDIARRHQNLLVQGGCQLLQQLPLANVHDALDTFLGENLTSDYLSPYDSFIRFMAVDGVLSIRTLLALNV